MNHKAILEGILFIVGDEGITIKEMANILEISEEDVMNQMIVVLEYLIWEIHLN